jgi:hypothetical protein
MRLGYSPTHNTNDFRTGSQRVALASSTRLKPVRPGSGKVTVIAPKVTTTVGSGGGLRTVGTPVSDHVEASGLVPRGSYSVIASLLDTAGSNCGTVTASAIASSRGALAMTTAPIAVCGAGTNTFVEQIRDRAGHVVAKTPPGQPSETFRVTPTVTTAVIGGTGSRKVGVAVRDRVVANGLLPNTRYRVEATLQDSAGRRCGVVSGVAVTDSGGFIRTVTSAIKSCGTGADTFVERILDLAGVVVTRTAAGQPSETFRVIGTVVATRDQPPAVRPRAPLKPALKTAPVRPVPALAATGGAPAGALVLGIGLLAAGAAAVSWSRQRAR